MTDDPDLQLIVKAANAQSLEAAGNAFMRIVLCQTYGLAYRANVHPAAVAESLLHNVAEALEEMTPGEWRHMQTRIADLLEKEAHEEAA